MTFEWDQLTDGYESNIKIVDENGYEIMTVTGSIQLGVVTSYPETDSYFGFFQTKWIGYDKNNINSCY